MTGAAQTDIVNLALLHLAKKAITSISDTNNPVAVACNRVWIIALKDTLRSNDWAFARVFAKLTESATFDPTPYGYQYAYTYPANCLAIRSIFISSPEQVVDTITSYATTKDKNVGEKYERMYDPVHAEELILTDVEDAYIKYTYYVIDPTLFDSSFVTALAYRLAAELAKPLTGSDDTAKEMIKLFNAAISDTQRTDSYENRPKDEPPNMFVDARV